MSLWIDSYAHDIFPTIQTLQAFAFRRRPLLQMLKQRQHEGRGKTYGYPILQQAATAQSVLRTDVQSQQVIADADFTGEEFTVGYNSYSGGFILDDFNMAVTENAGGVPTGAYMEEADIKYRQFAEEFGQRQEIYFIGRGGRSLAQATEDVATGPATSLTDYSAGTVEVTDRFAIANFRLGQHLQFSTTDGDGSGSVVAGVFQIDALDFEAGGDTATMTISAVSSTLGALFIAIGTAEAFIFNNGDFQGATATIPAGYQDWVTRTTPSGTFKGVVRTNDSRLGGFRVGVTAGAQLDTVIKKGLKEASGLYGASGKYTVAVSVERWTQLENLAEARGYRMLDGKTALGGYRAIAFHTGDMEAEVISVPSMSNDDMFFMQMDGWSVRYVGKGWPRLVAGDGLKALRLTTTDNYECRYRTIYHFGCRNINHQGRADISGISI